MRNVEKYAKWLGWLRDKEGMGRLTMTCWCLDGSVEFGDILARLISRIRYKMVNLQISWNCVFDA